MEEEEEEEGGGTASAPSIMYAPPLTPVMEVAEDELSTSQPTASYNFQ
jgi:hypothetical protein